MPETDRSKHLSAFVGVGLFLAVAAVIFEPVGTLQQALSYWYQPVAGRILKIIPAQGDAPPLVEYSYVVNGQRYFSERFSWIDRDSESEFDELLATAAAGDPVTVYVNRSDPQQSVIVRGLTWTAKFTLCWCCGPFLAMLLVWERFRTVRKPQEDYHRSFADRAEAVGIQQRLRMVPDNMTPLSAGIYCFVAMAVITVVVAIGGRWAQWWNISNLAAVVVALLAGTATGVFDYFYTLRGNQRGRWDLIVDRQRGRLQVPAFGAYGQPTWVEISEMVGFSIEPLVPGSDDEDYLPMQVLKLDTHDGLRQNTYRVHASRSEAELAALADWIWQAGGLPPLAADETELVAS